jgi:hypothetical protein
LRQE